MPQMIGYRDWAKSHGPNGITEQDHFFRGVAEARYIMRRVTRLVERQARETGVDPLEHQLLIQLLGAPGRTLNINGLGERLDVPAAVASRLVKGLEERDMVERHKSTIDRRVTDVYLTGAGRQVCIDVYENVKKHLDYFQKVLSQDEKQLALAVFGFYVGVALEFTDTTPGEGEDEESAPQGS